MDIEYNSVAQKYKEQGNQAYKAHDYSKAINYYTRASKYKKILHFILIAQSATSILTVSKSASEIAIEQFESTLSLPKSTRRRCKRASMFWSSKKQLKLQRPMQRLRRASQLITSSRRWNR